MKIPAQKHFRILVKLNLLTRKRVPQYLFIFALIFSSCANQQPPPGGPEDKTPPKVISVLPVSGTVNYSGNKIDLEFDEYVERRSFEESFFISPKPKGGIKFNWSGKEVEIEFTGGMEKNRTYTFTVGKDLKDVRGGNTLPEPIKFAFSTGSKIDRGKISGRVITKNTDKIYVFAYLIDGVNPDSINPSKKQADFLSQTNSSGSYSFENIPYAGYRLFAVKDNDRNLLYDKDFDEIAVLPSDIRVDDSLHSSGRDFVFDALLPVINTTEFLNTLFPDTTNYIFSSVKRNSINVSANTPFLFYFKGNNLTRSEIADGLRLADTSGKINYKLIFDWKSDSLLSVYPVDKLPNTATVKFIFDVRKTVRKYYYEIKIKTAPEKSYGNITGNIKQNGGKPVIISLVNSSNSSINYEIKVNTGETFAFNDIYEGDYILFAYIDGTGSGVFDKGQYFPYKPADKFYSAPSLINIKGGWKVENVEVRF